jgi:hypothetical protein
MGNSVLLVDWGAIYGEKWVLGGENGVGWRIRSNKKNTMLSVPEASGVQW